MAKYQYKASVKSRNAEFKYSMPVFSFKDDGKYIVYAPGLDLSGYGDTEAEAKQSFNECFRAFVDYTTNKQTLFKELKRLGWKVGNLSSVPQKARTVAAPTLAEMLFRDEYLAEVFQTKEFKKYNKQVALPV
ncbi:MAG: hypothetical protein L6Q81_05145 [Bacteroidia bacterium]|nr:hypothetical protein [Bacteroidia bacterium]